jgi:tRNA-specific 2-thiouridylase
MSGGVDSSATAALLVESGLRVVGITMRLYDASGTSASIGGRCCGPRDIEDARRVAAHLNIPHYIANHEDEFRTHVMDDFVNEYANGRTPNPCVRCNQYIKFTPLARRAKALGASALCTGHYARIIERDGVHHVARAKDRSKDQSYFLFNMPKSQLAFVKFPLGELTKEEVRAHAERVKLPNAAKPDSQEICFVPDGDYAAFVERNTSIAGGEIVDTAGKVVGTHEGIHRFTIGQRKGLRVAAKDPYYVVSVDALTRRVVVGDRASLEAERVAIEDVTWAGAPLVSNRRCAVQIRYRHDAEPATLHPIDDTHVEVQFDSPERGPAPGQAAVFYDGDLVLGGGFIADTKANVRAAG